MKTWIFLILGMCAAFVGCTQKTPPNIVLIYTDDVGYGDVACYGGQAETPNIDRIAEEGLRFTRAHCSSATCTPSRYSLLTGEYAWRRKGTGIAPGNASMIIKPGRKTIATMLQQAGYATAVIGKWHLGLGPEQGADWNAAIKPGPAEIGFDYSFLIPATGDRVPCVFVENDHVVNLDPDDPIQVSYGKKIGDEPTGLENPELLKMMWSHGHNNTIVNGIGRIGFMTGGKAARWVDEDFADILASKAKTFMQQNQDKPFFLYFSTHDIHVPRVPHPRFVGKTGMGPRGDAIAQLDWSTGEILNMLDELELADNTVVIFSSDNGPVLDDGYVDDAVTKLGDHKPAGPLRGGKYSAFEAGTRVPFIIRWPGSIEPGKTDVLFSQLDIYNSLAALTGQQLVDKEAPDSFNNLPMLLGKNEENRQYVIEHNIHGTLSIIVDNWKYIEPSHAAGYNPSTDIELGNAPEPQLYKLSDDIHEQENVAKTFPEKTAELAELLKKVKFAPTRQ